MSNSENRGISGSVRLKTQGSTIARVRLKTKGINGECQTENTGITGECQTENTRTMVTDCQTLKTH